MGAHVAQGRCHGCVPPSLGSAGTTIVSLKETLRGAKPPIWRRLLVPSTMTLGDLHLVIQAAMAGHAFDIDGRRYGAVLQATS